MKENWITNTKINIIPTAGFEGMGVQNAYDIKITDKMYRRSQVSTYRYQIFR